MYALGNKNIHIFLLKYMNKMTISIFALLCWSELNTQSLWGTPIYIYIYIYIYMSHFYYFIVLKYKVFISSCVFTINVKTVLQHNNQNIVGKYLINLLYIIKNCFIILYLEYIMVTIIIFSTFSTFIFSFTRHFW